MGFACIYDDTDATGYTPQTRWRHRAYRRSEDIGCVMWINTVPPAGRRGWQVTRTEHQSTAQPAKKMITPAYEASVFQDASDTTSRPRSLV